MLYSIIPPILIVFSLIGIIIFLFKKSEKVASLPEQAFSGEREIRAKESFLKRFFFWFGRIDWGKVKIFFLSVLEKIASKTRLVFLKLESKFGNWSQNIRKNRIKNSHNLNLKNEDRIMEKLRQYEPTREDYIESLREKRESTRNIIKKKNESEEKKEIVEVRPMLSEKITVPSKKEEVKNKLEEILIERIAANPHDVEAYERLGDYYMDIKDYIDAKECFKQVVKLDPLNRNAKYRIKRLESLLGD